MDAVPLRPLALPLLVAALAGCSPSTPASSAAPAPSPAPTPSETPMPGGLTSAQLTGLLLQPADLPSTPTRRESAVTAATTQPAPQLALCTTPRPVAAHQVATLLAKPPQMGQAQLFQLVSVFGDPAGANAAFAAAADAAAQCPSFTVDGTTFTVTDVARPALAGADETLQYRMSTPDVVRGDVRTLVRAGRYLVLLTGFGAPPAGQAPLAFQADAAAKALARLPR